MIRQAVLDDLDEIEDGYNEHFEKERRCGAVTVFKKGVYPTRGDAERAICAGTLYVWEEDGRIAGSVIADTVQPPEYAGIAWEQDLLDGEVMVIHLLLVRPGMAGQGIASSLIEYAQALARGNACRAMRLDTGSQNRPAVSLYRKMGFRIAAKAPMKVGNAIEHREHLFLEKAL